MLLGSRAEPGAAGGGGTCPAARFFAFCRSIRSRSWGNLHPPGPLLDRLAVVVPYVCGWRSSWRARAPPRPRPCWSCRSFPQGARFAPYCSDWYGAVCARQHPTIMVCADVWQPCYYVDSILVVLLLMSDEAVSLRVERRRRRLAEEERSWLPADSCDDSSCAYVFWLVRGGFLLFKIDVFLLLYKFELMLKIDHTKIHHRTPVCSHGSGQKRTIGGGGGGGTGCGLPAEIYASRSLMPQKQHPATQHRMAGSGSFTGYRRRRSTRLNRRKSPSLKA